MADHMSHLNIPAVEACEIRCCDFACLTNTDTALAQFYLQDRNWDLTPCLDDYSKDNSIDHFGFCKILTWNIDGLEEKNLHLRILDICEIIKRESPDVVFMQEIVPTIENDLAMLEIEYEIVYGKCSNLSFYYLCTLLKKASWAVDKINIIFKSFDNSLMDRGYLNLKVLHTKYNVNINLINCHLESTNQSNASVIRKKQLSIILKDICSQKDNINIFGGDLNIRDKEVVDVLNSFKEENGGHQLNGLCLLDIWEACGGREECRYTYDAMYNQNIPFYQALTGPGVSNVKRFKSNVTRSPARLRFDRLYLICSPQVIAQNKFLDMNLFNNLNSNKSVKVENKVAQLETNEEINDTGIKLEPAYFGLLGLKKVKSCQSYPSDHWGIKTLIKIICPNAT